MKAVCFGKIEIFAPFQHISAWRAVVFLFVLKEGRGLFNINKWFSAWVKVLFLFHPAVEYYSRRLHSLGEKMSLLKGLEIKEKLYSQCINLPKSRCFLLKNSATFCTLVLISGVR